MKQLLITGASSGIGFTTASEAARQGYYAIACGRNKDRLAKLKDKHSNIDTLSMLPASIQRMLCLSMARSMSTQEEAKA